MCKFQISSEIFKRKIMLALEQSPQYFSINSDTNEFIFECEDPIKMIVANVRQKYKGVFSRYQWENIYDWLLFLTEQPLTVKISDYGYGIHEQPEISVSCYDVTFYYVDNPRKANTRTISGHGKELEEEKLRSLIKFINNRIDELKNNTYGMHVASRAGAIREQNRLLSKVEELIKHTAQPAPVSVEDCVEAVIDDLTKDIDDPECNALVSLHEVRTAINKVLNPKP